MAESESLVGIPGLVSLREAAARSDCRYKCHSPGYILHARVVGLATLDYFTLCSVEALLITSNVLIFSSLPQGLPGPPGPTGPTGSPGNPVC